MIRGYVWQNGDKTAKAIDGELPPLDSETKIWIDLEAPTEAEEERVYRDYFPIHKLSQDDITRPRRLPEQGAHLPKVEEFPSYLFVIVNPLPMPDERGKAKYSVRTRPQLSAILTRNLLITHHALPLLCIREVWSYVERHEACVGRGPDYLFHLILDEMVDEYAPVVESLADQLDKIETRIFSRPTKELLIHLLKLKRKVSFLRKTLIIEREVLARLIRGEFALVEDSEIVYYRNVYDHLVRYTELVESGREMVSDLMQTHLAATSNRLNEVMKLLTMFSAIILPMSLIAGIYGMNFENLPEVKWQYGYYFAIGLMLIIGVMGLIYFRWKKWL